MNTAALNRYDKGEAETNGEVQEADSRDAKQGIPGFTAAHLVVQTKEADGYIGGRDRDVADVEGYAESFTDKAGHPEEESERDITDQGTEVVLQVMNDPVPAAFAEIIFERREHPQPFADLAV